MPFGFLGDSAIIFGGGAGSFTEEEKEVGWIFEAAALGDFVHPQAAVAQEIFGEIQDALTRKGGEHLISTVAAPGAGPKRITRG